MPAFPCVHDPGSIELLLRYVRNSQKPVMAGVDYLREAGFRREGDPALSQLLFFLGLTDGEGRTTPSWEAFRTGPRDGADILARAVRKGYSLLFERFPDPWARDSSDLLPVLRGVTAASDMDLAFMVLTFKVLCDLAGPDTLSSLPPEEAAVEPPVAPGPVQGPETVEEQPAVPPDQLLGVLSLGHRIRTVSAEVVQAGDGTKKLRIVTEIEVSGDPGLSLLAADLVRVARLAEDQRDTSS